MEHVVLVIHLIFTVVLIGLVLIQRSEGGGLGIGGSGGGLGGFASAQSTANVLTKITTIVAFCFFTTSLILAIIAARASGPASILDAVEIPAAVESSATPGTEADSKAVTPAESKPAEDKKETSNKSEPTVPIAD